MLNLKRKIKNTGKCFFRKLFEFIQILGWDVLPHHFYSGIPEIRALRQDPTWKQPLTMFGIKGTDLDLQMKFVQECCGNAGEFLRTNPIHDAACLKNGEEGFGAVESDFLFAFILSKQPKRIVQVGCGVSTAVMLAAAKAANYVPQLIAIDPYPTRYLLEESKAGTLQVIPEKAQAVQQSIFTDLKAGDFLFIDSTHTVKPGSEVNRLIFEILPRLNRNVYVHFHDIYFPYDYQRDLLTSTLFFCNESALLYAFLLENPKFTIQASLSMLHYARAAELQKFLPHYRPQLNDFGLETKDKSGHFPSSIYLQVIG